MKNLKLRPASAAGYVKRRTQQSVVNELGATILRGDYAVGANLPNEADLTSHFGVSRTVIREVMKTLAAKGLVVAKTKVGTRVAEASQWNLFDRDVLNWRLQAGIDPNLLTMLYELRLAMEPMSASLAAERRTEADIAELRAIVERMAAGGHSPVTFTRADLDFHQTIGRISRNPFMASIGPVIEAAINDSALKIASPAASPTRQRHVVGTHKAVVDAIELRDGRAAHRAMVAILEDGIHDRGGQLMSLVT